MFKSLFQYLVIRKSGLFDPCYYYSTYPDVRRADRDPLWHYLRSGWREGRNPSGEFNTRDYLDMNPDVNAAGVNPLFHYVRYGWEEGRLTWRKPAGYLLANLSRSVAEFHPGVTVIVPTYNHAEYLEKRLTSIYSQTYSNFDVILLDDCSMDGSREILEKYKQQFSAITRLVINNANSGNVFSQWKKGIATATGELVWIAESDDYCDADFLEKLVPFFADETVLLAYAHSIFVDENGNRHGFNFENYLADVSREKWNTSYVESAHNEVRAALGLRNSIPNVSSVVFRKPNGDLPLLEDPQWLKMKICGDWVFYLNLIRGGRIAFCNDTHNYFRIHEASSSKKTHTQDVYYREHEMVACAIARLYDVPNELLQKNHRIIKEFYLKNVQGGDLDHFSELYDINKVLQLKKSRDPNVLMAIYAFWVGGGEIMPIRLANAFKERGMSVLVFDGAYEPVNQDVRKMLSPLIPVVHYDPGMNVDLVLSEFGIEITHTHHAYLDYMFTVAKQNNPDRLRQVITMHGMYEIMGKAFEQNVKKVIDAVDAWFYIAEKNIMLFKQLGYYHPQKFFKIDNGMKVPQLHPVDLSPLGIGENAFTACIASRALPEKGWLESIEAVELARKATGKDFHLLLIGTGPVYELLQARKLPAYIHLLGFKSNVVDYLAASQVGLIPSYFKGESSPLLLIECFMAGKPVIASRIGETEGMLVSGQLSGGSLLDLKNGKILPEDISSELVRMAEDGDYYRRCIEVVKILKGRFNIDRIAEEYLQCYKALLSK
jgi:glycosyltransferase involved in cell wall biosynthesis